MNRAIIIGAAAALALALGSMGGARATAAEGGILTTDEALVESRRTVNSLMRATKATFKAFAATGDMAQAARGCSGQAHKITAYYMDTTGHYIRRVSLKYRNSGDVPDDYERSVLEKFDRLNEAGLMPNGYEDYSVITEDNMKVLRYMVPVKTKKGCLKCHGERAGIPEEVKKLLDDLYPGDLAIDYEIGEIRGAVSLKVKME